MIPGVRLSSGGLGCFIYDSDLREDKHTGHRRMLSEFIHCSMSRSEGACRK